MPLKGPSRKDTAPYEHLNHRKLGVIDVSFGELGCKTFADLGGVWAVDGGYSRYAADIYEAERGVLVDEDFTDAYLVAAHDLPALQHKRGNFGDAELISSLEPMDVAFFFDVLLHQVAPDWDEILTRYAERATHFAIVQPQWNGDETIRLLDLGREEYTRVVPYNPVYYDGVLDKLDEINPRRGRKWRDVHDIFQWGITDADLVAKLDALGYDVVHQQIIDKPWQGLDTFHESAYVFKRR